MKVVALKGACLRASRARRLALEQAPSEASRISFDRRERRDLSGGESGLRKKKAETFVQLPVQLSDAVYEELYMLAINGKREPSELAALAMAYAINLSSIESSNSTNARRRIEVRVPRNFIRLLRRKKVNTAPARGLLLARGLPWVSGHLTRIKDENGDIE